MLNLGWICDFGLKSRWLCLKVLLFLPAPILHHHFVHRYVFCPLLSKILCPRNPNLNPWNLPICCILQALACFFFESDLEGQDQPSVLVKTPEKSSCCDGLDSNEAFNIQNGAIRVGFMWDVFLEPFVQETGMTFQTSPFIFIYSSCAYKVHTFWEGHKILQSLPLTFDCVYCSQK